MPTMRIAVVTRLKAPFEIVERQISEPPAGSVRVKVEACGVCHSDSITKEGLFPGIEYPRAPGHEIAGVVNAIGANVAGWKQGERVGVGWHGGHCGYCDSCRRGDFVTCQVALQIPGISYDGGYADYAIAPAAACAVARPGDAACRAGRSAHARRGDAVQFTAPQRRTTGGSRRGARDRRPRP